MKHRREIDGLRALAILPVLFFHAGFTTSALDKLGVNLGPFDQLGLDGGYFGVDIFFVISGFLITGIIVNELKTKNKFSLVGFYERRARRIMPALFTVMITMIPVAWILLFSDQYKTFLQSLVSINFFVSNYFFLGKSGYFDPEIDLNPMLHTWSLAIEEQFYVFFPLILWVLWKVVKERYWIPILSVIALASLVWANTNWYNDPTNNFYLLQFRAWELIAGALAAIHLSKREKPYSSQVLSLAGLALLALSLFGPWKLVGSTMDVFPHPGFITLIPIVGTVLITMFAGTGTLVNRVLSWRFFVGIGLISYSAYLWHQPLFAFFRISQLHEPKPWEFLPFIAATLVLAALSWKFVENPFRNRNRFSRKQIFIATGLIMALISGFAYFASRDGVDAQRVSLGGQSFAELSDRVTINRGLDHSCNLFAENEPKCIEGESPEVLLWGDSYAMHIALALKASPSKVGFVQQTFSACAPVLGLAQQNPSYGAAFAKKCIKHNDDTIEWLGRQSQIEYVVLGSPWSTVLGPEAKLYNRDGVVGPGGTQGVEALRETIAQIKALGKKPIIVLATPTDNEDHGQCVLRAAANNISSSECDFKLEDDERHNSNQKVVDANSGAPTFWLDELICPEGVCLAEREGVIIYRDAGHLSREGSAYLGEKYDLMKQLIRAADRG
jgi:peptidoglycan/LPS O-acetylase OafA/YrhL